MPHTLLLYPSPVPRLPILVRGAAAALCLIVAAMAPALDTPTPDLEIANGGDVRGDGVHFIDGEKFEWVVDYWLDVSAMPPYFGRRYSSHRRVEMWDLSDTARIDSPDPLNAPEYETAPFSPGWTTFLDVRLYRITRSNPEERRLAVNMVPGPWNHSGKRLSFLALDGDFNSAKFQPRYYARASIQRGYVPPRGPNVLEKLPNGHSLVPADVSYTMTYAGECVLYFDTEGRMAGAQDFAGNGYAYDWVLDDEVVEGAITTRRRDMVVQHTEGAFATVTYRRTTDRTSSDPKNQFTDTTMKVQIGIDGPTIDYTYLRTYPNVAISPTEMISEVKLSLLKGIDGQTTKGYIHTYEYAGAGIFRMPEDAQGPAMLFEDPNLPSDRPNQLLSLSKDGEISRGRVEWKTHSRFTYQWLPSLEEANAGGPRPSLRPVCTSTRRYWGVPPKTIAYERYDIGYGPPYAGHQWTWDSTERPVATWEDGVIQGGTEFVVDVDDYGIMEDHSPSKRNPGWSRYRWWDFDNPYFNLRYLGSTTIYHHRDESEKPRYEHLYWVYNTKQAVERDNCFILETGSLGKATPREAWEAARDPKYMIPGATCAWYSEEDELRRGLMKSRTDSRGNVLMFDYARGGDLFGMVAELREKPVRAAEPTTPVEVRYREEPREVAGKPRLPTSVIVPPLGDPPAESGAVGLLSYDAQGRLALVELEGGADHPTTTLLTLQYNADGKLATVQHAGKEPIEALSPRAFDSAWGEVLKQLFDAAGGRDQRTATRMYLQKNLFEEEEARAQN